MELADATWTDAAALDTSLAVLPVGSTEQHGPHAPLGTDTMNAHAVATAAVQRYDGEVVVAPAIPLGVAEEHRHFAGTLWTSPDTFRATVRDAVTSLAHHGWDRVVVVNGHGGNVGALAEVCHDVTRNEDALAVPFTWFEHVGEHGSDMGHAGPLETALLRATHPELVREDRVEDARDGGTDRWGDWHEGVNLAVDSREFTENGVVGDPVVGDAAFGEELLDRAATALASLLAELATR